MTAIVFAWFVFAVFFVLASAVSLWDGKVRRDALGRIVWNSPTKEVVAVFFGSVSIVAGFAGVILGLWQIAVRVTR